VRRTLTVEKGLLSNTIRLADDAGETAVKFFITRRYNALLDGIRDALGAAAPEGAPLASSERPLDATRSIRDAVLGESRTALKAELA
jgi:hypothetical protein